MNAEQTDMVTKLYQLQMQRRNAIKFQTRFINSIRGQCRWYTNEIDNYRRKDSKSDALWAILGKHAQAVAVGKAELVCPAGIDKNLWIHIELRFAGLLMFIRKSKEIEKEMVACAEKLPCADWVRSSGCPGFSLLNFSILIGTVGNLSNFRGPSKLWKMVGLAPIMKDEITRAGSTWRYSGGLTADDWKEAKYSPQRRSMMFNMGVRLIQSGGGLANPDAWSRYSKIYYDRKEYERAKRPDLPPMAIDRRARRVMEKRLVRDLWCLWRDEEAASLEKRRAA
jgi:hypothetical protein